MSISEQKVAQLRFFSEIAKFLAKEIGHFAAAKSSVSKFGLS
jgi:hypothetical protein